MAKTRLNAIKKMDGEEDGPKDIINGIMSDLKGNLTSPAADCNSNNLTMAKENLFLSSNDSTQDFHDFLQDNSDYQWFLDYGYKYNNSSHHQSILCLTKSEDCIYYDDMARNIDANLAEVDMDDFNREDIHSVLSSLPNIQGTEEREMFASVTGSMMVKFDFDLSSSRHSNFQEEQINASICKSQLLFSPVRESYLPNSNLSVDSLDLSENDINLMVTCQSNKNNYTIAFEGSTVMTSDDSETREMCNSSGSRSYDNKNKKSDIELGNLEQTENQHVKSVNHLATSDSTFTTWSKIKENPTENVLLKKDLSRNNNSRVDISHLWGKDLSSNSCRSLSLPNLFQLKPKQCCNMSASVKLNNDMKRKSSLNNESRFVKLYDIQTDFKNKEHSNSSSSGKPVHSFSLVKLFIQQKSASHEGMSNFVADQVVFDENYKNNKLSSETEESFEKHCINNRKSDTNKLIVDNSFLKNGHNTLLIREVNGNEKAKKHHSKPSKQISSTSAYDEHGFYDHKHKVQNRNSYCSDESTQENGSNTESAENITCNSTKASVIGSKKFLTEKSIQTSKYFDANENTQKKVLKVPVYILYPNYSLPNLEFLRKEHYVQNIDFSKVFLKPQKFKMAESPTVTPNACSKSRPKRPFSVNDIETLKKTGFKHVRDWESLTFLLPKEYKEFLHEIPEIVAQLKDVKNSKEEVIPLFCLSPPPNRRVRKRPNSCDVNISNDYRSSNFSSTATQPSSGYRGSSTMLNSNQSNNTSSPRNPSFSYRYENNSESGSSRRSGSISHNRNYSCHSEDSNEVFPRPPLPKSILRNNSLDSQQYTCKTQKEYANKRYSMVELTDKNLTIQERNSKRRTAHNSPKSPQTFASRPDEQKQLAGDVEQGSSRSSKPTEIPRTTTGSNLEKDMRKLEELLEISAVFGESVESFTENDMMRLRSQVSKFLTMQKNLEKVSETLETGNIGKTRDLSDGSVGNPYDEGFSLAMKNLHTPHNTPEHKRQQMNNNNNNNNKNNNNNNNNNSSSSNNNNNDINPLLSEVYKKPCNCNCQVHDFEEDDYKFEEENLGGLKKTVSFAEKISVAVKELDLSKEKTASNSMSSGQKNNQAKPKRPVDLPICEESYENVPSDSSARFTSQNSADLFRKRNLVLDVKNAVKKILKRCKETSDDPANICLHHLCPSLYAVLSDGLKEEIDTPFGPIRNSVWSVIEASSQQGPMTQTLNELVQRLNREDIFTEGLIKFNAFIFGLLNARALSGWFSYLRTRDSLLRKHYENYGLLLLSNTAGAPVRVLVDQLINILESLGSLQFNLDLMYQTKLLHCSLQNLNCLLEEPNNSDFLTPTKQFMLLKLVQSIQNSISQSGEGKRNKHILDDIEEKTSDPPVSHLLEKNKNVPSRPGRSRTRPRSGCDSAGIDQEGNDVASIMKKRWSGVNMNSKLVEAFDRLLDDCQSDCAEIEDIEAPYKERESVSPKKKVLKAKNSNIAVDDAEADLYTKAQKKNILLNLNKKSSVKMKNFKTDFDDKESIESSEAQAQKGGIKFKRLQQKWERLSGRSPSEPEIKSSLEITPSLKIKSKTHSVRSQKSEKSSCDTNTTTPSPTSRISKIPRLVTSPTSSTPTVKQTGNAQKVLSPMTSGDSNQKTGKVCHDSTQKGKTLEGNATPIRAYRSSKCDEKNESGLGTNTGKNPAVSPTGAPSRNYNAKKNDTVFKRASSASLNRKSSAKKLHNAPRTVRTLTHRLPSDSGHLSFNEGEKLKVVLDVDKAWLLCCRGSQKGLVPKSLVISDLDDKF